MAAGGARRGSAGAAGRPAGHHRRRHPTGVRALPPPAGGRGRASCPLGRPSGADAPARRRRCVPATRPGPHVARHAARGDPPDRARRDRADRSRVRRARRATARDRRACGHAARPALRPGPALRDPRRDLRHRGRIAGARQCGRSTVVRPASEGTVRGRPHAGARGEALDDRLLPRPGSRWLAAGPALRQHLRARDATAVRGGDAGLPRVGPRPPPPDGDHAGADRSAGLPPLQRHHRLHRGLGAVHRAPVGGDGTPVRASWTASASSRSMRGARLASSSTPASTSSAGRDSRRSTS